MAELLIQQELKQQEQTSQIINSAGRERMLSQQISKDLLLLQHAKDPAQRQQRLAAFRQATGELLASHHQLFDDKSTVRLSEQHNTALEAYFLQLKQRFEPMETTLNQLLSQTADREPGDLNALIAEYLLLETEFLALMDQFVTEYARAADNRVDEVERTSFYLYLCVVIALLLTALLIFYPMTQKVGDLMQKLVEKEKAISRHNVQMEKTLHELNDTQAVLLDAEKRAILASTVAGIAHDVNTPLGICLTAVTHLQRKYEEINDAYLQEKIKRRDMEQHLEGEREGIEIIKGNLQRALELISNFKQIAVDQNSEDHRTIDLNEYLQQILKSLHPKLRKTHHQVEVNCPDNLQLDSSPSVFYQIFTNLIMNSLIHGFVNKEAGRILINVSEADNNITIVYRDNGIGISPQVRAKIFDPFYTTNREQGGSGLGTHIIYSMVTQELKGTITCESTPDQGITFIICFPRPQPDRPA